MKSIRIANLTLLFARRTVVGRKYYTGSCVIHRSSSTRYLIIHCHWIPAMIDTRAINHRWEAAMIKLYHERLAVITALASMKIRPRVLLASRLNVSRINRADPFVHSSLQSTQQSRIRPQLDKGDLYEAYSASRCRSRHLSVYVFSCFHERALLTFNEGHFSARSIPRESVLS